MIHPESQSQMRKSDPVSGAKGYEMKQKDKMRKSNLSNDSVSYDGDNEYNESVMTSNKNTKKAKLEDLKNRA